MATADVAVPDDVAMKDAGEADLEDRKHAAANEEGDEEEDMDMKSKALTNLLKTSSVFVAIMADKMKEQQRQNAERAKREAIRKLNAETKMNGARGPSRRSARTHQEGDMDGTVKQEDSKQEEDEQSARKGRGRPKKESTTAIKDKRGSIVSYLDQKQVKEAEEGPSVQEALAEAADEIEEKGEGLGAQDLVATEQPKLVSGGKMREYQLEGLEWLKTLWMNGLCGILADEMGLGKTVQAISLIAFFKENNISGPFLVAAPLSTVRNWIEEFKRWTPEINTVLYHGSKQEREEIRKKHMKMQQQSKFEFPVVVTSYEICMNDKSFLANYQWRYIVVDEGHRLKNMNCRLIKELMTYNSANRLLITGTPLQNNIAELWSLLHFLLPEVFNDLDSFERWFDFSSVLDDKESDGKSSKRKNNLVSTMHAILKPFLLRRVKTDVESSLPPKREYILYAPLTTEQKDIYKEILAGTARTYLEDKAVERIEARSRTASLKRKAHDSGRSTPVKVTKTSRAATPATDVSRADTPGSTTSTGSTTRRGRKAARRNYEEIGDGEFNSRLKQIEKGQDADLNGNNPSSSDIDSEEEALQARSKTLKLAKQEIASKKLQNPVMQARLACNSPHNFYWPFSSGDTDIDGDMELPPLDETLVTSSGKLLLLDTLLPHLLSANHKILIFSQFKTTLDILETYCEALRGWPVCRIDGSISQDERYEQITAFNSPKSKHKIFLLSTRAGGQGINLAAADTVILFDSDWNPQQDLQAMDRAHRIGQTRPVIVYRFATRGTVEETLLLKADSKRRLEKLVIQKGKFKSLIDGVDSKSRKLKAGEIDVKDFRSALGASGNDEGEGYEFEKYDISEMKAEKGGKLLADEELKILTDRRLEAYEKVAKGENVGGEAGQVWKVAETKSDGLEELTTRKNPKQ